MRSYACRRLALFEVLILPFIKTISTTKETKSTLQKAPNLSLPKMKKQTHKTNLKTVNVF